MALTQVDLGLLSPSNAQEVGMRNRIIDGGFIINQRGYVSGTSLSAGVYAHDRWKAGASGCTYTFTQGSLGVPTTITITAGSLIQVIEGCNLAEGGTYVLSWTGTAQGRLNGGTYGASGITITGWTPGTNLNVEFNTGTVGSVQLEKGSTATSFDYRPYGTELALCQRYYFKIQNENADNCFFGAGFNYATTNSTGIISFPVSMRVYPTAIETSGTAADYIIWNGANVSTTCSAIPSYAAATKSNARALFTVASGLTIGQGSMLRGANTNAYLAWSAEL